MALTVPEQGILLGEDKRLPDVTPPLRLRTEVSGVEARGRGESVDRAMERTGRASGFLLELKAQVTPMRSRG